MIDSGVIAVSFSRRLTSDIADALDVLEIAEEAIGEEVLTDYEESFVSSVLPKIRSQGNSFDLSSARQDVIEKIRGRLDKEGLL